MHHNSTASTSKYVEISIDYLRDNFIFDPITGILRSKKQRGKHPAGHQICKRDSKGYFVTKIFGCLSGLLIASLCRRIRDWRSRPAVSEYDWENA